MGKYDSMNVAELKSACKDAGITGYSKMRKADLLAALVAHEGAQTPEEPTPEPEPAKPVEVKGRSVGATTMAVEASKVERKRFTKYPTKQARNRAKARRRAIRAAGFQAGC